MPGSADHPDVFVPTVPFQSDESAEPAPVDELLPGARVSRYLVLKTLGRGGMGVVYMAYDEELDRRIALKLLGRESREADASSGAHRLLREAQALARLSHPNVVAVYDAGSFDGQVFLAMEYVDGVTLRAWRSARPRAVREIVAAYVQAGRGLEAAHAEGIFHRDFKPDNVVVDTRGRARVLDFGLARLGPSLASYPEIELAETEVFKTPPILASGPLTQAGELLGTPAYMAPEQLRGGATDARTDQFAFCVALHEALYGARPHTGKTLMELRDALESGRLSPAPSGTNVPSSVRAVLVRGLRPKPDERFASMGALLAALEDATGHRRAAIGVAVGAAAVVAATVVGFARHARPPVCAGAGREISSTWGDKERASVAAAFDASGNPRAKDVWGRVRPVLDDYAARWATMRTESCEATRVRGVQSDEALDLRTACLDQRRAELSATIGALETANAKLVDDAVKIGRSLSELTLCADVPALRAPFAQPHDPTQRAKVASIRDRIGRATALVRVQKLDEAGDLASEALRDARDLGNRALEGEALLEQAKVAGWRGKLQEVLKLAHAAALAANVARDDQTEAEAWMKLVWAVGVSDGRLEDAEGYASLADAAITRAGGPDALKAELAERRADVLWAHGNARDTIPLYEEALARAVSAWGPESAIVAREEVNLAQSEADIGNLREAITRVQSGVAKQAAEYGESPLLGNSLYSLAFDLLRLGDADGALRVANRLLATGVAGTMRIHGRLTAARALIARGDVERGRKDARDAIAEYEAAYGASDWHAGAAREQLAETFLRRHLLDDADAAAARAIDLLAPSNPDPGTLDEARLVRTICAARRGGAKGMLPVAEAILATEEKDPKLAPGELVLPLLAVGEAALSTGDVARAASVLERASTVAENAEGSPELHADVHFALARALLKSHGDAARARELALRAAREYDEIKLPDAAREARALAG